MSFEAENPKRARYSRLENEKKNSKKPSVSDFGAFMKGKAAKSDINSETDSEVISIDFTQGETGAQGTTSAPQLSFDSLAEQLTGETQRRLAQVEDAICRHLKGEALRSEVEAETDRVFVRLHAPVAQFHDFSHLELYGASLLRCHSLYRVCAVGTPQAGLAPVLLVNAAAAVTAVGLSAQAHSFHSVFKCRPNDLVSFVAAGRSRFESLALFATLLDNSVCFVEPRTGALRWKVEMADGHGPFAETKSATTVGDLLIVVNSDWIVQAYHVLSAYPGRDFKADSASRGGRLRSLGQSAEHRGRL